MEQGKQKKSKKKEKREKGKATKPGLEQQKEESKETAEASSNVNTNFIELDRLYKKEKRRHEATVQMLSKYCREQRCEGLQTKLDQLGGEEEMEYESVNKEDLNAKLMRRNYELEEENASVRSELQKCKTEIEKHQRRSEELKEKLEEEKKRHNDTRKMVDTYEGAIDEFQSVYEEFAKEDDYDYGKECDSHYEEISELIAAAAKESSAQKGGMQHPSKQVSMLEDVNNALLAEVMQLKNKLTELNAQSTALQPPPIFRNEKPDHGKTEPHVMTVLKPPALSKERPGPNKTDLQDKLHSEIQRILAERRLKSVQPQKPREPRDPDRKASVRILGDVLDQVKKRVPPKTSPDEKSAPATGVVAVGAHSSNYSEVIYSSLPTPE